MVALKKGALRELEEAGFTGNLAEIDSATDYSEKSLQLIDRQLESADFTDGESVYYTSRALAAKGLLDPASREQVIESAKKVGEKDWIPAIVPSAVTQAIYGDEKIKQRVFGQGKEWATGEDRRFSKIIGGWAMLAASADTPESRQEAYDIVMKDIETDYITMAGNAPIAAAILANEEQRREIFERASKRKDIKYWEIVGGNIVAMAIASSIGEERSQVFALAKQKLAEGNTHISNKFHLVAMALSAQTPEEKAKALSVIEIYTDTKKWSNVMNGWANIALGILGSNENERDLAVKSVAAAMESSR